MAKFILVNGAYEEHHVPLQSFNTAGWNAMLKSYRNDPPKNTVRNYIWLSVYDDETGRVFDDPNFVGATLKEVGKRVDQLSMSILPGWEERSFLGEPGDESGLLSQMFEDVEDCTKP